MKHSQKNLGFGKMPSGSRSASCFPTDRTTALDEKRKSEVQKSDILCSNTDRYVIQDFIGEGVFGKVAKCLNLIKSQEVALKILKTENSSANEREIKMLEAVSVLDPVKTNVAQFLGKFEHKGQTCLAFEMLDRSLLQLFMDRKCKPLSLSEIRPIAKQLLTALKALKGIGVVHSDMKSDNIMLANHHGEPFRVKLIDFGVSFFMSEKLRGCSIQPLGYRAPEVTLGLPISEAIDMWGLGCVLLWMYLAGHPFAMHCEYQSIKDIVDSLGQPADHLLSAGYYTHKYFKVNQHSVSPTWCLKTPREYQRETKIKSQIWIRAFESLDDLITLDTEMQESIELEDQRAFVRLLKSLLHMDPKKRITPEKALQKPFVTMAHLVDDMYTSLYVNECFDKMLVCSTDESEKELLSDNEASATPRTNGAGSAASRSYDGLMNTPRSIDEAAAASAASQAEETPATDGSPHEGPPVKVRSCLKRVQKFFGRAIRTCLSRPNVECIS